MAARQDSNMYEIKESVTLMCQHCGEKPHVGAGEKIFSEQCILYFELYFVQFSILYLNYILYNSVFCILNFIYKLEF